MNPSVTRLAIRRVGRTLGIVPVRKTTLTGDVLHGSVDGDGWLAILLFCTHSEVPLVIERKKTSSGIGRSVLRKFPVWDVSIAATPFLVATNSINKAGVRLLRL